jgi:hypothetical protein
VVYCFPYNAPCTDDVWVRNIKYQDSLNESILHIPAGWYSGKFNVVKLCHRLQFPSGLETLNPMFEKISIIWFSTNEIGWREPPGSGTR